MQYMLPAISRRRDVHHYFMRGEILSFDGFDVRFVKIRRFDRLKHHFHSDEPFLMDSWGGLMDLCRSGVLARFLRLVYLKTE